MNQGKKDRLHKKFKIVATILKCALLLVILIGVPLYIYIFHKDLINDMSSMENVTTFFERYKAESVFAYIGAQIVQIVICIIPGQWLQFAAGYMFGFWIGLIYSLIGATIGSIITYYVAKVLGRDAMHLIFGEEKIGHFIKQLNSKKAIIIVFLIFLIPGIPKDLCNYAAGLSDMKLKPFLLVSLVGRTPAMMGSLLIGKQLGIGGYSWAIIIGVAAIILFILGVLYRHKLMDTFDKLYDKIWKV
ncbi:MAG: VTT domain-containing protein [Anaerovoracaceae bacterium]